MWVIVEMRWGYGDINHLSVLGPFETLDTAEAKKVTLCADALNVDWTYTIRRLLTL
jgi:hypothetical protein